jgi:hypothetical protein
LALVVLVVIMLGVVVGFSWGKTRIKTAG